MSIVHLPEVLTGMEEAVLSAWFVAAGDQVEIGQLFAEIETEKAVVEYLAEVAGTVEELLVEPGETIAVGAPLVRLVSSGEPAQPDQSAQPEQSAQSAQPDMPDEPRTASAAEALPPTAGVRPRPERLLATPLVRRLARDQGLALSAITGSGPGGRIVRRDLEALVDATTVPGEATAGTQPVGGSAIAAAAVAAVTPRTDAPEEAMPVPTRLPVAPAIERDYIEIPHTGMRRAIARRLSQSKATVPHFYLKATCQVDALLELRRSVNDAREDPVSVNDFVVKAVAGAMRQVPAMNASWGEEATRVFDQVDIAVAVAIDGGLVTPVVRAVDRLSVGVVSETIRDLAARARDGRLRQHELEGGSFSISNLGMYGIEEFAAIINPPHAGILAVGAITERPVVVEGRVEVAKCMTVTLSGDHRVVDGAVAAQWLTAFKDLVEAPVRAIV